MDAKRASSPGRSQSVAGIRSAVQHGSGGPTEVLRILSTVEALVAYPFPSDCRKLSGSDRAYRIRIGDHRVIYEIIDDMLIIEVIKVGHHRDVYP